MHLLTKTKASSLKQRLTALLTIHESANYFVITTASATAILPEASTIFMASENQYALPSWMLWEALPVALDRDVMSNQMATRATPTQEVPCRRCLHDITVGDEVVLMSYDPFLGRSPYTSSSPIYIHGKECEKYDQDELDNAEMPLQQRGRLLSVRGFNKDHFMIRTELATGPEVLDVCREMLTSEGDVEYIHLHYAQHGCFAVKVGRKKTN